MCEIVVTFYDAFMTFYDEFCHVNEETDMSQKMFEIVVTCQRIVGNCRDYFSRPLPGVPFWPRNKTCENTFP